MDFEEMIQKVQILEESEITKVKLKSTLSLISIRNQDLIDQIKTLNAIQSGEEIDKSLREVVDCMNNDLDELDYLMTKKKQYESKLDSLNTGIEEN